MLDFVMISTRRKNASRVEVYPKFVIGPSEDLMIRGKDFYAVWDDAEQLWSQNEGTVVNIIDTALKEASNGFINTHADESVTTLYMWDSDSGSIDRFHKYVQKQCRDNFTPLDERLTFSNADIKKEDYVSKKLNYPLEKTDISAYEELISTLYTEKERHKIEWAIGSVVSGDSRNIQKFLVMYGAPGTGKSTVLNIIEKLFHGYCATFDAQSLTSTNSAFSLEPFKSNPLVAIQHEGDLSRIEDNTRLNSIVSHETLLVNEKNKPQYPMRFNSFLFIGTNKPVKITDTKSGVLRRLIDVTPSGKKITPVSKYRELMKKIDWELGGIATHCLEVYKADPQYYDNYTPMSMFGATNDFYNFVLDSYTVFKRDDETTLKAAYKMYNQYCEEARVSMPMSQRPFKEELKSYFKTFEERAEDGSIVNRYKGFLYKKFIELADQDNNGETKTIASLLVLNCTVSLLDDILKDCPAQYAKVKDGAEVPMYKWANVKTKLSDLDTHELHYVKVPENHIVIDFDLKDEYGNKSFELNAKEAALWPPTYAELSKGGQGVHLHYIYNGDVSKLSRIYDDCIEIKVFTGDSSLRRRLSKCNDLPIATISSGLPLKEENKKKMIDFEGFKNEKAIRTYIKRAINKEYASSTRQSMSLINDALEKAYASGVKYDISDMASTIMSFAGRSTNSASWCYELAGKLKYKSEEELSENFEKYDNDILVFFDVEVFKNLFVVVYMADGHEPVVLINPSPTDIVELMKFKLVGFNNRDYDNHILYARMLGASNLELFNRSVAIINKNRDAKIGKAYNISYTDVFDFSTKKQSLKKWEIELDIHHQELPIPWDQEVPEDKWPLVAEYCTNDVKATAALFHHLKEDWKARQILADLAGGTVNDTTNTLTTKLVFGNERYPQLVYTDLATGEQSVGR